MDDEKKRLISARILVLSVGGMNIRQAIDAVLGAGTVERIITELWEAAQQAAKRGGRDAN
jgi:hypothetical protein